MSEPVSFSALKALKQSAKNLRQQFPDLTHAQRLDLASRQRYHINYHETLQRHQQYVSAYLQPDDDTGAFVTCTYCGFYFGQQEAGERKEHAFRHERFERAENQLQYRPMLHPQREDAKKRAYDLLRTEDFDVQLEGALMLIRAHFDRSLDAAIDRSYYRDHPTFHQYIAMADDYKGIIPTPVMAELRRQFGKIEGAIEIGSSYWYPQKDKDRKTGS